MCADIMSGIGLPESVIVCVICLGALLVEGPTGASVADSGFRLGLVFLCAPHRVLVLALVLALAQWPAFTSTPDNA